jgi:hypothetical protein
MSLGPTGFAQGPRRYPGKRLRLDEELPGTEFDFTTQKFAEELHREVFLWHPAHFGEELLREDRDVGLLESGGGKDVDDLVR